MGSYSITIVGKPSMTKYTNLFQMFVGVEEGCCANSGRSKSDLFVSVYDVNNMIKGEIHCLVSGKNFWLMLLNKKPKHRYLREDTDLLRVNIF